MPIRFDRNTLFSRSFLRANIAVGLLVTVVALYMIFTGDYASHQTRLASETVLNRFAVGGLIYMGIVWSACQLGKPFMRKQNKN